MKKNFLIMIFLFCIALPFRISNLQTPFWVDEFSTSRNTRLVMEKGLGVFGQNDEQFEHHNITVHFLIAIFFKLFGATEWSARLPIAIIGSLIPGLVFIVADNIFNRKSAITSSLLTVFSYFEITWSRQARSYVLQQALILLSIWLYLDLVKRFSPIKFIGLIICLILGILTHTTFILFILALILHFIYLCFHWNLFWRKQIFKYLPFVLPVIPLILIIVFSKYLQAILTGLGQAYRDQPNNVWYYHSFLWRQQTIIAFLASIAALANIFNYKKGIFLLIVPSALYLVFLSFLFSPYVSRYTLPIFPLMLIMAGYGLAVIAEAISPKHNFLVSICLVGFILINGHRFTLSPKSYYSVNHDMREIALLDYDQVYNLIKAKAGDNFNQVAIIDTWPDRARWYLGYDQPNIYYFHWLEEEGSVNGLAKITVVDQRGNEKFLPEFNQPPIRFVGQMADLQVALSKYPQGFIWIDDASLPKEIIEYAKSNMKQELYLDHYPLDDNPYSIWPGTLYSWGFKD